MPSAFETHGTADSLLQDNIESMRSQLQEQLDGLQEFQGGLVAAEMEYSPATPANYAGSPPTTIGDALGRIEALLVSLNGAAIP